MADNVSEPVFSAFAAPDWADKKHAFALQGAAGGEPESGFLDHTPEQVQAWASELIARFGPAPIAVCLEPSRGPLVSMLLQLENFVVYPVPLPGRPPSCAQPFTAPARNTIRATPSCCSISCSTIGAIRGGSLPTPSRSASCGCWWPAGAIWPARKRVTRTA